MPERLYATHKRAFATTVVLAVLMAAAFALASWSLYAGHRDTCRARQENAAVLRGILELAQPTKGELAAEPQKQRRRTTRFFARAFPLTQKPKC